MPDEQNPPSAPSTPHVPPADVSNAFADTTHPIKAEEAASSHGLEAKAPHAKSNANRLSIPDDLSYSIIGGDSIPGVKRSLDVQLSRRASESSLHAIAMMLKSRESQQYDRTFICYYLPGMIVDAGAWATTHFTPNLNIQLLGLTIEEENAFLAAPVPSDCVGRWILDLPGLGSCISIYREGGILFLEQNFGKNACTKREVIERQSPPNCRFDPAEHSPGASSSTGSATPGQLFLKSKLQELDSFKSDPAFYQYGFGRGASFSSWQQSIDAKRQANEFDFLEEVAVGELDMLGLEYIKTKGRENDYTRHVRREISKAIEGGGSPEESGTGDYWIIGQDGNLQIWDDDGLIATARRTR